MANFEQAIETVLDHEGGYVNNVNDSGGATNWGLSERFLNDMGALQFDYDHNGYVGPDDIKKISLKDAKWIYKTFWWDHRGYDKVKSNAIATKIFDTAVNVGKLAAVKFAQRALNSYDEHDQLEIDGIMGSKTINALNIIVSDEIFLNLYSQEQLKYYERLVAIKPSNKIFFDGWKKRALS
jgi:lysozyme family protein